MDRNVRAAALGLGLAWLAIAPTPDGALSALDRQQVSGYQRSPAAGTPAVVAPGRQITLLASSRAHALAATSKIAAELVAPITRVQYAHVYPGTSKALTLPVTAGNLIIVAASAAKAGVASCSDSLGNVYRQVVDEIAPEYEAGLFTRLTVWYAYNVISGTCTVTARTAGEDFGFTAIEYTSSQGKFTADPFDGYAAASIFAVAASLTVSLTTTRPGMLLCAFANENLPGVFTGWTAGLAQVQLDAAHIDAQAEALNKPSGTYTMGATLSALKGDNIVALIGFKNPGPPVTLDLIASTRTHALIATKDQP